MEADAETPAVSPYRETQLFGLWTYALLIGVTALMWYIAATLPHPANILFRFVGSAITVFSLSFVLTFLCLRIEVTDANLDVSLGWVPSIRRVVPIPMLRKVEVVRYRPLADWGGWGYRLRGKDDFALNARGDRGVQLEMTDGARLLVGSQRPEALAEALRSRMLAEQT